MYAARLSCLMLSMSVLFACAAGKAATSGSAVEGRVDVADLQIVDCLLPGQVRQLGTRTYLTARRPVRTTAVDCRIRGGEYVAYDRADYASALRVWLPAAEQGDTEAQTNVGEIFERGLGGQPNYAAAVTWYRRAADQGDTRAQFNLGTLYEQGLGVQKSPLEALNWYRRAWGIAEDDVIFRSAAEREQNKLREQLERRIKDQEIQLNLLERQHQALQSELAASEESQSSARDEARSLKSLIDQIAAQRAEEQRELAALPITREPIARSTVSRSPDAAERTLKDLKLGRYYALLIGNERYDSIQDLNSPIQDINRARKILEEKYGFTVLTITNGDNVAVMQAINDLNEIVGPNDNLLLFYAGHGTRLQAGDAESGYWLPSNAEPPPRNTFWVPNEFVTGHLARIQAKRVLVVADSCYAGLLSNEPSFLLVGDNAPSYANPEFLRFKLEKRSRLLLSSGGDSPVLDGAAGTHSVFANAFLDTLASNQQILSGPELFLKVRDQVASSAARLEFVQVPDFKAIKAAGHEVGDFFFVPLSLR